MFDRLTLLGDRDKERLEFTGMLLLNPETMDVSPRSMTALPFATGFIFCCFGQVNKLLKFCPLQGLIFTWR